MATAAAGALVAGLFVVTPVQAQEDGGPVNNLVQNGSFAPPVGDQWWGIDDDDVTDGVLCVTVPAHERFGNFVNLGLEEGQSYQFGFTAYGDPGTGGLQARIQSDGSAGPEEFDVQETFAVTPEPQQFQWDFIATGGAVQRVQFEFSGAAETSELCMSDVFVTPVAEVLQNPTFDGLAPWWTTEDLVLEPHPDGGVCGTVPAGGDPWTHILGQNDLTIVEGNTYTVTITATANPAATVRVIIPIPGVDFPAVYDTNVTLTPDGDTFTDAFEAESDAEQFMLQVGGQPEEFELCMQLASLTTGGEIPEFEHETGPRVRVNQVGYLPNGPKNATLVTDATEPLPWELLDSAGAVVASGDTVVHGFDPTAGLDVHTIDFSDVAVTGTGFRLAADGEESYPFEISSTVYDQLRLDALNVYYSQRSGIEIVPIEVDGELLKEEYARPAGHVSVQGGPDVNQGDFAVPCLPNAATTPDHQGTPRPAGFEYYGEDGWICPDGYTLDVVGGWYDAGDHGKYVVNSGIAVYGILSTYERTRHADVVVEDALGDATLTIPERGNGVPDILDEAKWNLDWMLTMQVPDGTTMTVDGEAIDASGLAHHKMHDIWWTGLNLLPHEDPMPRFLHRPSTAATLNLAAAAAQGSRIYAEFDQAYADQLLDAAVRAWDAATAHPAIFTPVFTQGGGPYDDGDDPERLLDEFYWAAAQLFLTTGEAEYRDAVLNSPLHVDGALDDIWHPTGFSWQFTAPAGRLDLATVPNDLPGRDAVIASVIEAADGYLAQQAAQPFGMPYGPHFDWGSSHNVINNAVVIATAFDLTGDPVYRDGALEAIDYVLGRNAINNSYVKGYGTFFSQNMHSRWYRSADRLPDFPDGKLAGGPNPGIQDPVAEANLQGCAPQACYIDDIGSWSTNETAINWNSALTWYASWAADMALGLPEPAPNCLVTYTVHGSWPGGFNVQIWLENIGEDPISGWELSWQFPGNQTVVHGWSATYGQDGSTVTATNLPWNATLAAPGGPGQSKTTIGFVGNSGGSTDHVPEAFTLNGLPCAIG